MSTVKLLLDEEIGLIEHPEGFDVPEDQWQLYSTLVNSAADLEATIIADFFGAPPAPLPDDLQKLVGILSDEEIQAVLVLRSPPKTGDIEVAAAPEESLPVQVITKEPVPPCTRPGAKAGAHTPGRYFLNEDGTVDTQCPCGRIFRNVKCPHQKQMKIGKNVCCSWCRKVIIRNTGMPDDSVSHDQAQQLYNVNTHQWDGNADG